MNTAMIDRWHSIQLLRQLLKAGREQGHPGIKGKETLDMIKDNLLSLRKAARPVVQTRTFVDETTARVEWNTKNAVNRLMQERPRTRYETEVGGKHAGRARRIGARVVFQLGYRWHDKVYPLINALLNGKDILPISAVEYRVNAPNVRLWQVKVWDFKKKQEVMGYIGQSKLNDKCIFTTTVASAITAAERTTIKTVDEKLGIKENQNG